MDKVDLMNVDKLPDALQGSKLPRAWKELAILAGKQADERFDPVCFLHNHSTDTQVLHVLPRSVPSSIWPAQKCSMPITYKCSLDAGLSKGSS